MKNIFSYLKKEFQLETPECMNNQQKVALKNLIEASRERVWMAEPLHVGLKDVSGYSHDLPSDTQQKILDSANIVERYLHTHTEQPTK